MAHMNSRLVFSVVLSVLALVGMREVGAQQTDGRVALVIGNAAYPDAEAPLRDPVENMRAFAEELRRVGFEVDTGENLTKQSMRSAIDRFYGKIKPGATAVFFFSGYGIQSARQTYMIPTNGQIWIESDLRRDGFSLNSVLAEMNTRGARVKIAIVDASRRNPFERRFRAVAEGLAPVSTPPSTMVMYAAAPGAVVRDNERELFVSELLKEIRIPGKVEEAFNRTQIGVSRASQGEQVPWFSSTLVEDFSFVTAGRPSRPQTSTIETDKRPPPVDREADARREYQAAERVGTKKSFEDFVRKYPSGRYSELARDQIAKLDVPAARPKSTDTAAKPKSPAPPVDREAEARREYQAAERTGSRQSFEDFLARYPSGRYSELARDQIAKLDLPAVRPVEPVRPKVRLDNAAIRDLDKTIQLNPGDALAYYKRGQLLARHGDFARAIEDFDEVIRLNPKDAEAFNNRCWSRAIIGELQPALTDCNEALKNSSPLSRCFRQPWLRQVEKRPVNQCHCRLRRGIADQSEARTRPLWAWNSQGEKW